MAALCAALLSAADAQTSASLTAPANNASNLDPTAPITFTWASIPGAQSYVLDLGTTPGAQNAYASGNVQSTSLQVQLQASTTYYATLWTNSSAGSYSSSLSFNTGTSIGSFTAPLNGATNVDPFAPITWTGPSDTLSYELYVSTQPRGTDLYFSFGLPPTVTSRLPWGLQPSTTYYARLYTLKADGLHYQDIQFQTAAAGALPNRATFYTTMASLTAQVRGMTAGSSNNANPGTVLYQVMLDRGINPAQNGADCTSFAFALLNVLSSSGLLARYRAITLNGVDSHAIVEYWDPFNAEWSVADSTFGLMYFDNTAQSGWSADDVSQALRDGNVASIPIEYVSPYYDYFMRTYYTDPITLYNNVVPMGGDNITAAVNPPQPFLNAQSTNAAIGQANIYTALFAGSSDSFSVQNSSLGVVKFAPYQTSLWSTEEGLYQGWTETSQPPTGMQLYTYKWVLTYNGLAGLTSPVNGSVGVSYWGGVQFAWTSSPGADAYKLQVGTSAGGSDIYNGSATQTLTANVAAQPSTTYYVRLWTERPQGWFYQDTVFTTAMPTAQLISPVNGATSVASPVTFTWTSVPNALSYALWLGSSPGADDVLYFSTAAATSTVANLSPAKTYYVRLWTKTSIGYTYVDSTIQTASTPNTSTLISPANGATVSPQAQFTWTPVPNVTYYQLYLGSSVGASDYYNSYGTTATSRSLALQPGKMYDARLWTFANNAWSHTDSTFQTSATSYLTAPANGAKVSPQAQFTWTTVPNVTYYELYLGSSVGASDYYNSYGTTATSLSLTLQPGRTYYARLWTFANNVWSSIDSVFQTSATSYLISPVNGATVSPLAQFTWTAVPNVTYYQLYLGSSVGASDYYNSYGTTATSLSLPLQPGKKYYARVWTFANNVFTTTDSTFQTAGAAYLTTPANGATISPQAQFTWTSVPNVTYYELYLGSSVGASDYYNSYGVTGTSLSLTLQPGKLYYARLWTFANNVWSTNDSTFQTSQTAVITTPSNGASNLDPALPIAISWTPVPNVTYYQLYLGSSLGASNYYNSYGITATSASVTLKSNTTYYARLWTFAGNVWTHTDSVFSTGYPLAHLTYPLNGATNVGPFLPFTWTQPQGATEYLLTVSPTGYGVTDFFVGVQYVIPTVTSEYVWGLHPNTTYYAQLCTGNPGLGGGGCVQTSFSTGPAPSLPPDRNAFYTRVQNLTAQVRLMTQGFSNVPIPGSPLFEYIVNHAGNTAQGTSCGWFAAALLDQFTENGILARRRDLTVDGADGHVVTEYWDPFNQKWQIADPTFGLVYFDTNSQTGQGMKDVETLLLSNNLSAIEPLFVTNYGSQYMTTYYLDPITLYANVQPFGLLVPQQQLDYVPNSPLGFLNDVTSTAPGTGSATPGTGRFVFQFVNPTDKVTIQSGSSTLVVSPANTEGWAVSTYLEPGWNFVSPVPDGMRIYTFKRILF